jgi:hypothetical protein
MRSEDTLCAGERLTYVQAANARVRHGTAEGQMAKKAVKKSGKRAAKRSGLKDLAVKGNAKSVKGGRNYLPVAGLIARDIK